MSHEKSPRHGDISFRAEANPGDHLSATWGPFGAFTGKIPCEQDSYVLHVLQLVAEHVPQDALPPMGADTPSPLLEKEAKDDSILLLLL